ncbi:MAG: Wzz/FepE/Etk N-terminal domain-containing protein [Terracidiphilus sp.]
MRQTNVHIPIADGARDLSVRDFVAPLFRRKRVLIATFFGVLGGIILLAMLMGPAYSSRMAVLVNRERLDPLVSTEATTQLVTTANPVTQEEINSEVELLGSRDVLEKVVLENGLENSKGFSFVDLLRPKQTRDDRIARAVKTLARQIKIKAIKDSNLIEVTYKSADPQLSYNVLKSLGDLYLAKHVAVHRPAGSLAFFSNETDKYRSELQRAEDNLRSFDRQNAIAAPDEQRTQLAAQVAESVGLQHQAEQSIAADQERIKEDQIQMRTTPARSPTAQASSVNDKLIGDLNAALLAAQTKRTQLALKYDPSYPLVREADQEIAQDKAAIAQAEERRYVTETTDRDPTYELLREDIAKSEADLSGQRATLAATKRSIQSIQAQMVNLDQLSVSQQDLQREAKAAESNYLLYLAKREQERTSNALDVTRIANVAIAVPPAIPVLPVLGWPMIVVIALFSATFLAFGAAYAMDYFDRTFHTPAQVIDILDIPVVISMARKTA